MTRVYSLVTASGARFPIRADGVVIGRSTRCDVVLDEPSISRIHAIIYAGADGPSIVAHGKISINGRVVEKAHALSADDQLELAGTRLTMSCEDIPAAPPPSTWMIRGRDGQLFGVPRTGFTVGGGELADLRVPEWPAQVFRFHLAEHLHVEAIESIQLDDEVLEVGAITLAKIGSELAFADQRFRVTAGGPNHEAVTAGGRGAPDRATLEFLPRGGRLTLAWGTYERLVYLPERRCELVALLLQPPEPHVAGELIPDELVIARLWPGRGRSRVDLNVVIHRARADLLRAELDGAALLQRAVGGNATRFALDQAARVTVV